MNENNSYMELKLQSQELLTYFSNNFKILNIKIEFMKLENTHSLREPLMNFFKTVFIVKLFGF